MAVSQKQLGYAKKYLSTLDEIRIRIPKGKKDEYKSAAEASGKSLNQFIIDCIEANLQNEKNMKKYTEMTRKEIKDIVNRGGSDRVKLNEEVMDYLDTLDLSSKARDVITGTDISVMAEVFGGLMTAQEVEDYVDEYFSE